MGEQQQVEALVERIVDHPKMSHSCPGDKLNSAARLRRMSVRELEGMLQHLNEMLTMSVRAA